MAKAWLKTKVVGKNDEKRRHATLRYPALENNRQKTRTIGSDFFE